MNPEPAKYSPALFTTSSEVSPCSSSFATSSSSQTGEEHPQPSHSLIATPTPDDIPRFPMGADDFFAAICTNNLEEIENWYYVRRINIRSHEQAGLDLAIQLGHVEIAAYIEKHLIVDEQSNNEVTSVLTKRHGHTFIKLDRPRYFQSLRLETYYDGSMTLSVNYKTQLPFPYLRDILSGLGGRHERCSIIFDYDLNDLDGDTIYNQCLQVLCALVEFGTEHGYNIDMFKLEPILQAIDVFMHDRQQGFPDQYTYSVIPTPYDKPLNTYAGYTLSQAASQPDPELMFTLLRDGIDPNLRFDREPPLWSAVHLGFENVFSSLSPYSIEEGSQRLLETIKVLILYGADPLLETMDGETIMECVVRYSQSLEGKPLTEQHRYAKLGLYQDIIALLTTSKNARPHILVHPETLISSSIARTVETANQFMKKQWYKIPSLFGASRSHGMPNILSLRLRQGAYIQIESIKVAKLGQAQYEQLFSCFASHPSIQVPDDTTPVSSSSSSSSAPQPSSAKRDYFDKLLRANITGTIDMISQDSHVKGFIISKFIATEIDSKPALIYFTKFGLAHASLHPGLITSLIWLRGFAGRQHLPEDMPLFAYYDAASAGGFAGAHMMQRFPVLSQLKDVMPTLIQAVHGKDIVLQEKNGCYYIKGRIQIDNTKKTTHWPTLSALVHEIHFDKFARSGQLLPVSFLINRDNFLSLQQFLSPIMSRETLGGLMSFYAEQTQYDLLCQTKASLRPKL